MEISFSEMKRRQRIRLLNDRLRQNMRDGRIMLTSGIMALEASKLTELIRKVMEFDEFSEDNDPHQEHDFGALDFEEQKIFWKIDYYDKECRWGSPDPTDPTVTTRVLTVLLASEY